MDPDCTLARLTEGVTRIRDEIFGLEVEQGTGLVRVYLMPVVIPCDAPATVIQTALSFLLAHGWEYADTGAATWEVRWAQHGQGPGGANDERPTTGRRFRRRRRHGGDEEQPGPGPRQT
jgi:hypothetical protein